MPYSPQFEEAFVLANRLHGDQLRKKTHVPYITHLMSVAALVAEFGGDEQQVIAGLLHDAVEDQGGAATLEQIHRRFGQRVARIVEDCTDTDQMPKPPWRERKEQFLDHLRDGAADDSVLVAAADKLHNARSIVAELTRYGPEVFNRFNGGREGTLWYYRAVTECLRERGAGPIVAELAVVVERMHEASQRGQR